MLSFHGKILLIDLSSGESTVETVSEDIYKRYLGGKGLGTYLLKKHVSAGVDPLSGQNSIIFAAGPLTGSGMFGTNRYGVFSKSPLTGGYAESYSGGRVGAALKKTGYDAVVIKGRSSNPVFIHVSDNGVNIHDAGFAWGFDTYKAQDALLEKAGKNAQALVIGPGGENLVSFACIENNYWRSAGRTGMGAVMGSKKLKGIVFEGEQETQVYAPQAFKEYLKNFAEKNKDDKGVYNYKTYGTPQLVSLLNSAGAFPTGYWAEGVAGYWKQLSGEYLIENFEVKSSACPPCLMSCGKLTTVNSGKYEGLTVEGPEYETIYAFGGLCEIDNLEDIIYLNDLCDRYGIDTITAGNIISFYFYAASKGKITLPEGDRTEQATRLIEYMVNLQGTGKEMAGGIKSFSKYLAMEEEAVHVKGLEPAGYDPRRLKGMGLAYATSARGACHLRATFYKPELAGMIDPQVIEGKAKLFVDFEDRLTIFDTLIMCKFYRDLLGWQEIKDLLELVTGWSYSTEELQNMSNEIITETRRFNYECGLTGECDRLPRKFYEESLEDGKYSLSEEEVEYMLRDYYNLRGWDSEGNPV